MDASAFRNDRDLRNETSDQNVRTISVNLCHAGEFEDEFLSRCENH